MECVVGQIEKSSIEEIKEEKKDLESQRVVVGGNLLRVHREGLSQGICVKPGVR